MESKRFHPLNSKFTGLGLALGLAALSLCTVPVPLRSAEGGSSATNDVAVLKKLSLEELMNVEVTLVSRRPEKLSHAASAIQVVTQDDLRQAGVTNLPDALRLASNLEVAQVDSHTWAISARGFNSTSANKLLVMMDGRVLYSPLHASVFWDVQDTLLEDIDRIEVISGPGATQWGTNAVNGVINIVTKSAKETQGLLVEGGGGNVVNGAGGVRYGGAASPNLHFRVYAKYADRDATELANGTSGQNQSRLGQGGFRVDWDASDEATLTLQGDGYVGRFGQPTGGDTTVNGGNLLGKWTRTLPNQSNLSLQTYYDRTHRRIPGTFAEDLETYDLDFQHHFSLGERHGLTWGIGYRFMDDHQHNDYPVLAFLPAHVTRKWISIFGQDEIAVANDLYVTLGSKIEHNDYTGFEIQPSARVAWLPNDRSTVWAAVSRAIRSPSRIDGEFFAPRDPPFTLLQGNPDFQSEELLAYELGFRVRPRPEISLNVAVFYQDYDKLRSTERVNPTSAFPIVLGNKQAGFATGAELTADYQATTRWRLRAGYSQLHLRLHNETSSTAPTPTDTDPEHQFFLRSLVALSRHWEFAASYRLVARLANARVPAYDELDLRLGWNPTPALEISLTGENLLHRQHAEFGTLPSRQMIGRGIFGKIVWRF